jgi:hypothetical protein
MKSTTEMAETQKIMKQNKLKLRNLCFRIKEYGKNFWKEDKVKFLKKVDLTIHNLERNFEQFHLRFQINLTKKDGILGIRT